MKKLPVFGKMLAILLVVSFGLAALWMQTAHADTTWNVSYQTTFPSSELAKWVNGDWQGNAGNGELETYQPSQVVPLSGGGVQLVANHTNQGYVSGLIQSQDYLNVTPGSYIQATMQVPAGQGFWPAFWLWNNGNANDRTEFDISEIVSPDFTSSEASIHANDAPQDRDTDYHCACDFSAGFHTFGMWWEPGFINFTIDGVTYAHYTTNIPTESMFIVFNLAVGGNWPGDPTASTPFASAMTISDLTIWTHGAGVPASHPDLSTNAPSTPTATPISTSTPAPRHHHRRNAIQIMEVHEGYAA